MRVRRSRLVIAGMAVLIAGVIGWSFRPQPVPVDIASVVRGALRVTVDEEGMTRVRERYVISAPVAGRLQRLELKPGNPVSPGTVIATFRPATPALLDQRTRTETEARMKAAQAARDEARVGVQRAADELAFHRKELARQQQLAKIDAITEERLAAVERETRDKEALLKAAELGLEGAEHDLSAARAALQQVGAAGAASAAGAALQLRATAQGVILRVHQESEGLLAAGTPLIEIGDLNELEIVADLLSTDAVKVQPKMTVVIGGWGGDAPLPGHVRYVEPSGFTKVSALGVEEQRVNVLVDFDTPGPEVRKLGDGYRVEVSIVIWERNGVLKVPTSALFRVGNDWAVFAVHDGQAAQTIVQIGQRSALEAEVVSGLAEGAQVIVHPGDTVGDGVRIVRR